MTSGRMNLLYATPFLRVPPDFGAGIRHYHLLAHLAARHQVAVVTYGADDNGETDRGLNEIGCKVVRLPMAALPQREKNRRQALARIASYPPSPFRRFAPPELAKALNDIAAKEHPDLCILDTQMLGQVTLHYTFLQPCVLCLLDLYEISLRRMLRTIGVRPYLAVYVAEWLKTMVYERQIVKRFGNVFTVSPSDRDYIRRYHKTARLFVAPNGVDTEFYTPLQSRHDGRTLLFAGALEHGPNRDAVFYFHREILPIIRAQCPGIRFIVLGRNPPPELQALAARDPGVVVLGPVADVRPYYAQSCVAVVPLRYGGGTKLKTLEAFAMGLPVVSTRIGCEGLDVKQDKHLLIADRPSEFANSVLTLLNSADQADRLAANAREFVARYDWKRIAREFEQNLAQIAHDHAQRKPIWLESVGIKPRCTLS